MPTPIALFEASPVRGIPGTTVTFTNLTTYSPSATWWDFGDGFTSATTTTVSAIDHTYDTSGTYSVFLSANDFCAGSYSGIIPLTYSAADLIIIATSGAVSAMDLVFFTAPSGTNTKISILEKIFRLTELHDPDLIDIEYIQYFANNLGYSVDVDRSQFGNVNTGESAEDEINRYLRFMVRNLPNWYKIKATRNAVKTMLFSFGLIGDLIYYYTKDYDQNGENWAYGDIFFDVTDRKLKEDLTKIPDDWYPTPHFAMWFDITRSGTNFSFDKTKQQQIIGAINSIKPINTVFKGVAGYWSIPQNLWIQPYTPRYRKQIIIPANSTIGSDWWA